MQNKATPQSRSRKARESADVKSRKQANRCMTCFKPAALKRCHELLQEAHAYVPENEAWHDQVTEILLPCDEAHEP